MAQVCQAISEMSTTLGDLENTFTQKMQAFLAERPQLATHVTGLKEDITGLIKVLSEKLVTSSDVEATIEDELAQWDRRIKDEFVKKQQDMSTMAQPPAQPRESGALPPPGIPTGRKTTDGSTPKRPSVRRSRADVPEGRTSES